MRTLCRQFSQFIVGTDYKISSIASLNNYQAHLPSFNIIDAAKGLIDNSIRNIFGLPLSNDRVRLFDMLCYGLNLSNYQKFVTVPDSFNVNPFRFLAYQKVYFDHYRNPLYELNDPSAYNVDSGFGAPYDLTVVSSTLRYRNWNKDYFTSLSPSFQGRLS